MSQTKDELYYQRQHEAYTSSQRHRVVGLREESPALSPEEMLEEVKRTGEEVFGGVNPREQPLVN